MKFFDNLLDRCLTLPVRILETTGFFLLGDRKIKKAALTKTQDESFVIRIDEHVRLINREKNRVLVLVLILLALGFFTRVIESVYIIIHSFVEGLSGLKLLFIFLIAVGFIRLLINDKKDASDEQIRDYMNRITDNGR